MAIDIKSALELRNLVYGATTATIPNLGGHHGVNGFSASIGMEVLRSVDTFIGQLRANQAKPADVDQLLAQCNLARTTDILSDSDMEKADKYLDDIKEQL